MGWQSLHQLLILIQRTVSVLGILIIISGVFFALGQYLISIFTGKVTGKESNINLIRMNLGRVLILGLEFIVAADLIGTTTTPDYYALGILAIIVLIRTMLSFSINRELISIKKEGL